MSTKRVEQKTKTDICYAQIAHNRYLPQLLLFVITILVTIIIFSYRLFLLEASCLEEYAHTRVA